MDKSSEEKENMQKRCLNCGAPLTGKYCAACGQRDLPQRQSFRELLVNFIGSFTSFESKFFKTVIYLLFRPGFLAVEYNLGRREAYYHPARAYVFISFVFFLVMSLVSTNRPQIIRITQSNDQETTQRTLQGDELDSAMDSLYYFGTRSEYDSIQQHLPERARDGWLTRIMKYRFIDLHAQYKGNGRRFIADLQTAFLNNFPKVFFLLLPVFALLLWMLHARKDFYYTEHLVFSIQYYNFFFLMGVALIASVKVPWLSWMKIPAISWIFVYLLLAMKRMYRQSWGITVLKFFSLIILFICCISIGFGLNFFITLFII